MTTSSKYLRRKFGHSQNPHHISGPAGALAALGTAFAPGYL